MVLLILLAWESPIFAVVNINTIKKTDYLVKPSILVQNEHMNRWCTPKIALFLCIAFLSIAAVAQENTRPIIRQLSAEAVSATKIRLTWKVPKPFAAKSILIYKDTKPFATRSQLETASPIAELKPKSNYYIDTVQNYKAYYYAVIAKEADGTPYAIVLPSINATVNGVRVQRPTVTELQDAEIEEEKLYADGQLRELPLPYLNLVEFQMQKPHTLKPEVLAAGKALSGNHTTPSHKKLAPYIFDEDMISPSGGDEYFLFDILKDYFIRRNYAQSIKALQQFLSINRSQETTMRAAFYLGESLYFCGKYRQALMMFLYVEDETPAMAKKWIQSTLDLYKFPNM